MLHAVHQGREVVVLVCPCCRRIVLVRVPEIWRYCGLCGERVDVPADDGATAQA